ncbi:MAG: helix-turn-helix domain-containing protein, partial [Dehalococcoidales bacterium]|nr:helix-turn-helix domain-containing protein [Dehalococcoidales bacterium]
KTVYEEGRLTMLEQHYTIPEVAEKLKLSPKTVYNWIKQGRLTAVTFGRKYRISESEIVRYLREQPSEVPNTAGWGRGKKTGN